MNEPANVPCVNCGGTGAGPTPSNTFLIIHWPRNTSKEYDALRSRCTLILCLNLFKL